MKRAVLIIALILIPFFFTGCSSDSTGGRSVPKKSVEEEAGEEYEDESEQEDESAPDAIGFYLVYANEVDEMLKEGAIAIDIRESDEIHKWYPMIPDSVNIPMSRLSKGLMRMNTAATYIVVSEKGKESHRAVTVMQRAGFKYVFSLDGGAASYWNAHPDSSSEKKGPGGDNMRKPGPSPMRRF